MTEDEFDPLPADMMRARRMKPGTYVTRIGPSQLEAFTGRAVHHINGDPTNNNIDNLELRMTVQEERDRAVIARRKAGEKRHIAAIAGTIEWVHDKPNLNDGRLPEAAFDWPIYRAAMVAEVYGAMWGQASPEEEKVLDTLAHCAGLQVSLAPAGALTGHDCAYCGAIMVPGVSQVCREQGGDEPGTWHCSEGTAADRADA